MSCAIMAFSPAANGFGARTAPKPAASAKRDATMIRVTASEIRVSASMKRVLAEEEGVRLTVYRDVAGHPTVGVGHLVTPADNLRIGDRIDYAQALAFLNADLAHAEKTVRDLVGHLPLYQHEFDALVGLVYNVGEGNVSAEESPALNAAVAAGDYSGIARELAYHTAGGALAQGLVYRSERRQTIFSAAQYDDPRPATARLAPAALQA